MILSVIIPFYNVESYLAQCLDSVFKQDLTDCEVICVNDGSTDNSRNILEEYKSRYPNIIIIDREKGGMSAARNSGLQVAQGEYIYFLDSDDFLYEDVLSRMLSCITEKQLDVLCCNALKNGENPYFDDTLQISEVLSGVDFCKKFHTKYILYFPVPVWIYMYRRAFFQENNIIFKEGYIHEDEDFSSRVMYYARRVFLLNIPIEYHRIKREGAVTSVVTPKHLIDSVKICRDLFNFYKNQTSVDNLFFESIFLLYLYTIKKSVLIGLGRKRFFSKEDILIMQECAQSKFQKKCVCLAKYSFKLMSDYHDNKLSLILRKLINKL